MPSSLFYRRPFVFIVLLFLTGILAGHHRFPFSASLILFVSFLALFGLTFRFISGRLHVLSVGGLIISAGMLLVSLENDSLRSASFSQNYLPGDVYRVRLEAVSHREAGKWQRAIGECDRILRDGTGMRVNGRVLLYFSPELRIRRGDLCLMSSELQTVRNRNNPGEFDAEAYWRNQGIRQMGFVSEDEFRISGHHLSVFNRFLDGVRNYFRQVLDHFLEGGEQQVAQALLLGDRDLLERETTEAFSKAGIMHLLAVSGLHVGIFYAMIIYLAGFLRNRIRRRQAILIAILLIWFYAFLTGLSASVFRAVLMFSVIGLAEILRRRQDAINTLFLAAFVILVIDPLALFDIGFQLSFTAMLSIYLFNPYIVNLFRLRNAVLRFFWEGTAVGLAAQVLTFPLSLYYFHQFPNYFWLANLVVILLGGVILGSGLLLVLFAKIPFLNKLLAFAFGIGLWLVIQTGYRVSELPFSAARGFIPSVGITLLITALIILWRSQRFQTRSKIRFLIPGALVAIFLFVHSQRATRLSSSNLVVYNANFACFSIKLKKHTFFFYEGTEKQQEQASYLARAFSSTYPATVSYLRLKRGEDLRLQLGKRTLIVQTPGNGIMRLLMPGEEIAINSTLKEVVYRGKQGAERRGSFAKKAVIKNLLPARPE